MNKKESNLDRRNFLKGAGLAIGAAGAVSTVAATEAVATTEATTEHAGYRETEHVRTYYDLARF